jgi:hypothetical protein
MSHLLQAAIAAHGGLDRWNSCRKVSLDLSVGGALWDFKRQTGLFGDAYYEAELDAQRAIFWPFRRTRSTRSFFAEQDCTRDRVRRTDRITREPRGAFRGHQTDTPWDRLHAAYFDGYAL